MEVFGNNDGISEIGLVAFRCVCWVPEIIRRPGPHAISDHQSLKNFLKVRLSTIPRSVSSGCCSATRPSTQEIRKMCDWSQDKAMASWDTTYVSTNLRPGSPAFDSVFFLGLNRELSGSNTNLANIAPAIIVCHPNYYLFLCFAVDKAADTETQVRRMLCC